MSSFRSSSDELVIDLTTTIEDVTENVEPNPDTSASKRQRPLLDSIKTPKLKKQKLNSQNQTPPSGYCVAGIDIGLKNFAICLMQQNKDTEGNVHRPAILEWRNTNLYQDRVNGKIIRYEAADKLLERITKHLDDVGRSTRDWKGVDEVAIESQAASTNAIRRVETMVFSYYYYKHPHIKVKTISASRKLTLPGMNHSKEESSTYKGRKNLAIQYARQFMKYASEDCPFKHILDPLPRKRKGEVRTGDAKDNKADDAADSALSVMYVLGVGIPLSDIDAKLTSAR